MSKNIHLPTRLNSTAVPMLFDALAPELKTQLIAKSPLRTYNDGQFIQHRGTKADGFWLIDEGTVRVGIHLPAGEFRAVAVLGPGDSYGELAVFAARPRVVDALSRGVSRVRFIAAAPFLTALAECSASNRALLGALSAQLQDTLDQLAGMRRGSKPARLAGLLANLAGAEGKTQITQQELAELLGVTRATANSALRVLEEAKLIERGYGAIRVLDQQALALFAIT
ncbi:MAG: Crp/Fnr family transcriptional regulator [Pseudomonadota bacterium]